MTTAEAFDQDQQERDEALGDFVYFQISMTGVRHVIQNADKRAAAVYTALTSGVDHRNTSSPRACTHGALAVEARTGLDRKNCVPALVEELVGIDAIQRTHESPGPERVGKTGEHPVRFLVDPERLDDLVDIDQRFLDPCHGSRRRAARRRPATVISDFMRLIHLASQRGSRPFTDALLLFFALHQRLDYGTYAGVDPKAAHAETSPLREEGRPIDDISHVMRVPGNERHRVVLVQESGFPRINATFAQALFKDLPGLDGEAPWDRAAAALSILRSLNLVSSAHVLWSANPLTRASAAPIATLYVKGGAAFTDGRHLQHDIDAALKKTGTITGRELYPRDADESKAAFAGSGVYRYILQAGQVDASVVLTQLRLKHVADSDSHRNGLAIENLRCNGYRDLLDALDIEY